MSSSEEFRQRVLALLTNIEDVVSDEDWEKIDVQLWNAVTGWPQNVGTLQPQRTDPVDVVGLRSAIRVLTPNLQQWIGTALDELEQRRSADISSSASGSSQDETMADMREAVSDFRKATFEFAQSREPGDHEQMLASQVRIFEIARKLTR